MRAKMSKKPVDRRIGKTRDSLARALFKLMHQQSWNAITIQSLCDEANVARASFYGHFTSKVELLDFLIAESFEQQIPAQPIGGRGDYFSILSWLVDHIASSRPLFSRIASEAEVAPVLGRFKRALQVRFEQALMEGGIKTNATTIAFVMGGTFDAILHWSKRWQMKDLPQLRQSILAMARAAVEAA